MIDAILNDARLKPSLFLFNGPVEERKFTAMLERTGWVVPDALKVLWLKTGGGQLFESETILAPLGDVTLGDDVESVNAFHRNHGLSSSYLVFHVGLGGLTAVRITDQKIVTLSERNYVESDIFDSVLDWYQRLLRAEYAERYGLNLPKRTD